MALTSYQFMNQPYWLGFVFAGQAFTVSYRQTLKPKEILNIQISTSDDTIAHLTNRTIISSLEQIGIKLIKNPTFTPGRKRIPAVNLDGRSKISANSSFFSDASNVHGGNVLEESMIPRYGFGHGGIPVESSLFERILQYSMNYILSITNEGFHPTEVMINIAFYESGN